MGSDEVTCPSFNQSLKQRSGMLDGPSLDHTSIPGLGLRSAPSNLLGLTGGAVLSSKNGSRAGKMQECSLVEFWETCWGRLSLLIISSALRVCVTLPDASSNLHCVKLRVGGWGCGRRIVSLLSGLVRSVHDSPLLLFLRGLNGNYDEIPDLRYLFFFFLSFLQLSLKDLRSPSGERRSCGYRAYWHSLTEIPSSWKEESTAFFLAQCLSGSGRSLFRSMSPISSNSSPKNLSFSLDSPPDYQGNQLLLPESALLSSNFA